MANRRSNNNGGGLLEAILSLIGSLFLLGFVSGSESLRLGLLLIIIVFFGIVFVQVNGVEAILFLILLFGGCMLFLSITSFFKGNNKKNEKDESENYCQTEAFQHQKKESFEDQLKRMENHVRAVRGENYISTQHRETEDTKLQGKYYQTIKEAVEEHSIPRTYKKIMIERIQNSDVVECPGLMWKKDGKLYVLPLLKNSKIYSWPLDSISVILYETKKIEDKSKEYSKVAKEKIISRFKELLPSYLNNPNGVYSGKFILPIGLEVTNTSGKNLFSIVDAKFHVVDDITNSTWYVKEIKELYQKNILRENNIISLDEYDKERERLLNEYQFRERNNEKYEQQLQIAKKLSLL
ncbi:hypothetical protein DWZ83_02430 [Amedibacillus dolichus]|uniref:Uncharacterized protein n=1 Tax=Amedibacillus dolichus TaxID=31971 RepID=A0A415PP73_9FIRM|nr:hypothetical protein [Amedibacillus dolichus]RHM14504.1 hypothetical protein DWZ83_02430 [Amedibacillus dolichus]